MKVLCVVCELWLVQPVAEGGVVSYWCERCHSENVENFRLGQHPPFLPSAMFVSSNVLENRGEMASQVIQRYVPNVEKARRVMFVLTGFYLILGVAMYFAQQQFLGIFALIWLVLPLLGLLMVFFFPNFLKNSPLKLELSADGVFIATKKESKTYSYAEVSHFNLNGVGGNRLEVKLVNGRTVAYMYPTDPAKLVETFNGLKTGTLSPNSGSGGAIQSPANAATSTPLSIVAFVFAFVFPIVGLVLGYVAQREILHSNGRLGGLGLARAAIAISSIVIFIAAMALFFWFLVLTR